MRLYGDTETSLFLLISMLVIIISAFMYFYTKKTVLFDDRNINGELLEKKTAEQLKNLFGINVIPNVILDFSGGTTEIDMVQITTKGIFVVECKYRSSQISGNATEDYWHIIADGREIAEMYSPIKQNRNHIKTLETYLKQNNQAIPKIYNIPVVSAKKLTIKKLNEVEENVILVQGLHDLQKLEKLPDTMSTEQVKSLQEIIGKKESTEYRRRSHVEYIKNKTGNKAY